MSWSLNEVEGLARKAARGSGLSWGLAEEAGKSTRWLMEANLPGADALAGLLTRNDGSEYGALCPADTAGTWQAPDGQLCPLITGAVICDHAASIAQGDGIELGETSYPLLLLPFAAGAAQMAGTPVEISWPGCTAQIGTDGDVQLSEADSLETDQAKRVQIRAATCEISQPRQTVSRCDIPGPVAKTLGAFAHRTYAPDTPESRLAGAGAGLTDND